MCTYTIELIPPLYPQILIPDADTTYWCAGFKLPDDIQSNTKHMIRVRNVLLSVAVVAAQQSLAVWHMTIV